MSKKMYFSSFEVHQMLNHRAGREITAYEMKTLICCWRISKGLTDEEQSGFTRVEVDEFLKYAY